jgi:hypothetical protein
MADDMARKRFDERMSQPFAPIGVVGAGSAKVEDRIANALEYIAAQMGQINATLKKLAGDKS